MDAYVFGMKNHGDIDDIQNLISYDPETGEFRWKVNKGKSRAGAVAGTVKGNGYRMIGICGIETTSARLAWYYHYGKWPTKQLVHLNDNRQDVRISNLAELQHSRDAPELTQDRLKKIVCYNPETGLFTRLRKAKGPKSSIIPHGWIRQNGYAMISIDGVGYRVHRLVWLYVYGRWPTKHIDHINGNPSDNRLCNLREADVPENMANSKTPRTNTSGYKGVTWHKLAKKWMASIRVRGTVLYLGLFDTPEAAHAAYSAKALETKGEFARV